MTTADVKDARLATAQRQFPRRAALQRARRRQLAGRAAEARRPLGRTRRIQRLHGGAMAPRPVVPGARRPSALRAAGAGAARHAAPRRRLGNLSWRAERRHQHHRRGLCGAALARAMPPTIRRWPRRRTGSKSKGGLRNVRVFTRYWLALIGEWPWEKTPNLPPEVDLAAAVVPVHRSIISRNGRARR